MLVADKTTAGQNYRDDYPSPLKEWSLIYRLHLKNTPAHLLSFKTRACGHSLGVVHPDCGEIQIKC